MNTCENLKKITIFQTSRSLTEIVRIIDSTHVLSFIDWHNEEK